MKKKNILITGSKGFIGKNLKKELLNLSYIDIYEFNRCDSFASIEDIIGKIDFIFHLAGEVRPTSSDEEFIASHNNLTTQLINIIEKNNKKIPILLTSSKHASNPNNMYGLSKKETEDIIKEYGDKNKVSVMIYRLSHVFGEGCKPNYNSVISTWIYNSINDLEFNVFDRKIPMKYLYVQDIVQDFIQRIENHPLKEIYYDIDDSYDTTLGEVIDYLNEFKLNINNENYHPEKNNIFKVKLYNVYLDYLKNNG